LAPPTAKEVAQIGAAKVAHEIRISNYRTTKAIRIPVFCLRRRARLQLQFARAEAAR